MIHIVEGNILDAREEIIAHQVNCQGRMASGLGKQIAEKYPDVLEQYKWLCNRYEDKRKLLGQHQLLNTRDSSNQRKMVCNLFGQLYYGRDSIRYTSYNALYKAMTGMVHYARFTRRTVALPFGIGCGLANGEWSVVEGLIKDAFQDYDVTLYQLGE